MIKRILQGQPENIKRLVIMGSRKNMASNRGFLFAALILAVTAAELVGDAAAATYVVGDSMGWTVPPGGRNSYATWASGHVFRVGDVLVFNFTTGFHDVAQVNRAGFDGCTSTNPIGLVTIGPASFTLNSIGEDYYICTFGQHCSLGQKLVINVTSATSTTPAPAPSAPTTTPSPTPSPGSTSPSPTPMPTPTPTPSRSPSPSPSGAPLPAGMTPSPTPGGSVASPPSPGTPGGAPGGVTPPPSSDGGAGGLSPLPPSNSATTVVGVSFVVMASMAVFGVIVI